MNDDQATIQRLRRAWMEGKRKSAARRRHEKADQERARAEINLIRDTIRQEGIDPDSALGQVCLAAIVARKNATRPTASPWCDDEGFPID